MSNKLPDNILKLVGAAMVEGDLKNLLQAFSSFARFQKIKFDALIKEGFTESQALKLCERYVFPEFPRTPKDKGDE